MAKKKTETVPVDEHEVAERTDLQNPSAEETMADATSADAAVDECVVTADAKGDDGSNFADGPEFDDAPDDNGEYDALLQAFATADHGGEESPLVLDAPPEVPGDDSLYESGELQLPAGEETSTTQEDGTADPIAAPLLTAARSTTDRSRRERVLTIGARDEVQTKEEQNAIIWHEIRNAFRVRRILTGTLDGVEKLVAGTILAVVNYKGFRVAIPVREMLLESDEGEDRTESIEERQERMDRLHRILNARLGSEIDFIVKGCDNKSHSVIGSRKEAMYRKRKSFFLDTNELGEHLIYEGRVVQARVVGVAEKIIRVEVFGVETSIVARGLSWEWIGNARDYFSVGDRILVRVLTIDRSSLKGLKIEVDVRSVSTTTNRDNLKQCQPQCRYMGRVTDVRNGVVFVRLNNGVNAIAHSCYDSRYPGKKDDVSFAVTRIDEKQGIAIGIITRIIKQNL